MAQIEHIPQQVLRGVQPIQIAPLALQEQVPLQIPPVQQVETPPQPDVEIHEIHSDLEEEAGPISCPVNILTSMTSSIPDTQLSTVLFYALFHRPSFSHLNLFRTPIETHQYWKK